MKIVGHADPGDQRRCAHPTDDRNKFKYSSENTQRDCVRESEDEQNRRIGHQGKEAEKNLSPDISEQSQSLYMIYLKKWQETTRTDGNARVEGPSTVYVR